MFQVQFCKFKGVRNWSCCLVLELLSLWTSWRCFWDLTICCCSLLSINMNCPPPALPVSCRGQKNLRKWWIVREFLIILNIWCRTKFKAWASHHSNHGCLDRLNTTFFVQSRCRALTGTSWVRWLYQESIHIRLAGDIKTVLYMEKVVHRFMVLKVSWRLLSLWPQKDTFFIAQWELVLSA